MKKISIIAIIVGALTTVIGGLFSIIGAIPFVSSIVTRLFAPSSSIGIIGGADGPTAIFATNTLFDMPAFLATIIAIAGLCIAVFGVIVLIVGVVFLIVNKLRKKD